MNAVVFLVTAVLIHQATCLVEQDFTPVVTATCKAGYMTIRVQTNSSFIGALHAKDYRTPACLTYGNGSSAVTLSVNLFAQASSPEFCGVRVSNRTGEERSLPIVVRIHRTLELADDKFYVITCGKAGFRNARNETSIVTLKILSSDRQKRVKEVYFSYPYVLRAQISKPDGAFGIKVRSCMAMNKQNNSQQLIDEKGCPVNKNIMSRFIYNSSTATADAEVYSMFEFPDGNQIHFQCDVVICKGGCMEFECDDLVPYSKDPKEDGILVASTSAFVLQPGTPTQEEQIYEAGFAWGPGWLVYLAIALGVLFLLMLIINVFLCSAMTCSCTRTEIVDKEPSIIDDYDPYRTWHASPHYGSRYSLNGKAGGYMSGGSTLNSARSVSTNSDHYAIVDSRQRMAGGPPSHYSKRH